MKIHRTIKTRIILGFSFFAFFISLLFSFYNFIFAYTVEDEFFKRLVEDEASYIDRYFVENGYFPSPRQRFFSIHTDTNTLPDDFRLTYLKEPQQVEFYGDDQRHYHLITRQGVTPYILVAEISEFLVVRPIRKFIVIFLGISSALMLVLSAAFGYWTASRTTRPLTRLAREISHTRPDTLPQNFADQYPKNEIGVVASSLEQAMQRISAFIEREQHFTRDASHELRTPIAVVKGAVELLRQQPLDSKVATLVSRIERACQGMEQTVAALLMLARETKPNEQHQQTRVLPLIEQTILAHHHLLLDKPVHVDVDVAPELNMNLSNPILSIIVNNLVSNAFQYTSEGNVTIAASQNQLTVTDTGSGIDESIKEVACETLIKGEQSKGFGIGLSIVKRLCEKYRLDLGIHSDQQGTKVTIRVNG